MMYKYVLMTICVTSLPCSINCAGGRVTPLKRESRLKVIDNGPGVSGFPITFTATYPSLIYQAYEFEFVDVENASQSVSETGRDSVSANLTYFTESEDEDRFIRVTVYLQLLGVRWIKMDESLHSFKISKYLTGSVKYFQENISRKALDSYYVATNEAFGINFYLFDPSHNFDNLNKSYRWTIDNVTLPDDSYNVSYTLSKTGNHSVSVNVTVSDDKGLERYVPVQAWVKAQDRLESESVNVVGKYFLYRNESLSLKIKCSNISKQSGPFTYCTSLNNSSLNSTSSECPPTALHLVSNTCDFSYSHYFHLAGKYQLIVQLWNEVSVWSEKIEITVMPITPTSALSFVVIPVLSVILVVIIITISVAIHLQQRKRYTVEVADFDFRPDISDEDLIEKTFIQRLKDSYREEVANGLWYCFSPGRQHLLSGNNDVDSINDLGYASTSVQT